MARTSTAVFRRSWGMRTAMVVGLIGGGTWMLVALVPFLWDPDQPSEAGFYLYMAFVIPLGLFVIGWTLWHLRQRVVVDDQGVRVERGRHHEQWGWSQIRDVGVGNFTLVGVGPYLVLEDGTVAWLRPAGGLGLGWTPRPVRRCADTISDRLAMRRLPPD